MMTGCGVEYTTLPPIKSMGFFVENGGIFEI